MKTVNKWIVITSIICLTIIQITAMYYGINGTFRTFIFGAITGLAGFALPNEKFIRREHT